MKSRKILWIAVALAFISTLIDLMDGYVPKLIGSAAITLGLIFLLLDSNTSHQKHYKTISLVFFSVAFLSFAYRLLLYFEII